jgi:hypothetical protein
VGKDGHASFNGYVFVRIFRLGSSESIRVSRVGQQGSAGSAALFAAASDQRPPARGGPFSSQSAAAGR